MLKTSYRLMYNLALIFVFIATSMLSYAEEQAAPDKETILDLLYKCAYHDFPGEYNEGLNVLIAYRKTAFPIMAQELLQPKDDFVPSTIMGFFVMMKDEGDNTFAINAISDFLDKKELKTNMDINNFIYAAESIGKLGGGQRQIDQLFQILEHKNNGDGGLQCIALRNLGRIGDKSTLEKINQWLVIYKKSPRTAYYEYLTTEADKAIALIQERIKKRKEDTR